MSELEQSSVGKKESTQDVEDQEMISHTEIPHSAVHAKSQEPIPDTENQKVEMQSEELDNKDKTERGYGSENNNFQTAGYWIQVFASIATVIMAILAWQTLLEMQTERNNAYRPEIVVTPNSFEGGLEKDTEPKDEKEYLSISYRLYSQILEYEKDPDQDSDYVILEKPYLTLKNIGQGTAKNIQVTFPINWIEDAVATLNDNPNDNFSYQYDIKNKNGQEEMEVRYFNNNDPIVKFPLLSEPEIVKNITYIAPDDDLVNVALPDGWCSMLEVLFNQKLRTNGPYTSRSGGIVHINIPDLVVIIQYSDMQGRQLDPIELTIPWTGTFTYSKAKESSDAELKDLYLRTSFYEDYIR